MKISSINDFVNEMGLFMDDRVSELDEEELHYIHMEIRKLLCGFVAKMDKLLVVPELNHKEMPPCAPKELVNMKRSEFEDYIHDQRPRLEGTGWSAEDINQIDEQFEALKQKFQNNENFKTQL